MAKDAWVLLSCPVLFSCALVLASSGWLGDVRVGGGEAVEPSSKKPAKTLKRSVGRFCVDELELELELKWQ